MPLPDGRRIGVAEYGVRGGTPILHFHGLPGGRFYDLDRSALVAHGTWLLTVERPGIGLSDVQPGRSLLDWPRDVEAVADRFGLERFAVLGTSAGAPYALACGYALADRVAVVGLQCGYCGMAGDDEFEALDPYAEMFREYRADPVAFRLAALAGLQQRCDSWAADPDAFFDAFLARWPENDRPRFAQNRDRWMRILAATYGVVADIDEDEIQCRPWGFALEDVQVPVHAWHGEHDEAVPLKLLRLALSRLPDADLTVYPNVGHYLGPDLHREFLPFLTRW